MSDENPVSSFNPAHRVLSIPRTGLTVVCVGILAFYAPSTVLIVIWERSQHGRISRIFESERWPLHADKDSCFYFADFS